MRLVPTTLAALDAEDRSGEALSVLLGVGTPTDWPPPFNDAGTRKWMRGRLVERPDLARWTAYYIVADIDGVETVVGNCGFKGEPDAGGMVEVGYSIVPDYHRRGIGTAALSALLDLAFGDERVERVTAETPVDFCNSRRLLEKCGFSVAGERHDDEDGDLVVYEIRRETGLGARA